MIFKLKINLKMENKYRKIDNNYYQKLDLLEFNGYFFDKLNDIDQKKLIRALTENFHAFFVYDKIKNKILTNAKEEYNKIDSFIYLALRNIE